MTAHENHTNTNTTQLHHEGAHAPDEYHSQPSEYLPAFSVSPLTIEVFSDPLVVNGLLTFVNRSFDEPTDRQASLDSRQRVSAFIHNIYDPYTTSILRIMQPLFIPEDEAHHVRPEVALFARFEAWTRDVAVVSMRPENVRTAQPTWDRVSVALGLLDDIVPLDQDNPHNPTCDEDTPSEHYGRHWVDFVSRRSVAFADADSIY